VECREGLQGGEVQKPSAADFSCEAWRVVELVVDDLRSVAKQQNALCEKAVDRGGVELRQEPGPGREDLGSSWKRWAVLSCVVAHGDDVGEDDVLVVQQSSDDLTVVRHHVDLRHSSAEEGGQ
jgi:hypothetical protein